MLWRQSSLQRELKKFFFSIMQYSSEWLRRRRPDWGDTFPPQITANLICPRFELSQNCGFLRETFHSILSPAPVRSFVRSFDRTRLLLAANINITANGKQQRIWDNTSDNNKFVIISTMSPLCRLCHSDLKVWAICPLARLPESFKLWNSQDIP